VPSAGKTPPKIPALIAAAVLLAVPVTSAFEGLRTHPYHDPGDGRATVCFGETERAMRSYTADECKMLLRSREAKDYAPKVWGCVPQIITRREVFAASIDASYNAGLGAFCRSPMARKFNAGDWAGGCAAFQNWRVTGGGKVLPGLVRRRAAERALCMKGAG